MRLRDGLPRADTSNDFGKIPRGLFAAVLIDCGTRCVHLVGGDGSHDVSERLLVTMLDDGTSDAFRSGANLARFHSAWRQVLISSQ
jgi:hypothetical protein